MIQPRPQQRGELMLSDPFADPDHVIESTATNYFFEAIACV